jgi:hypothetical protein
MTLDAIAVHLIETTATAATVRATPWAATALYVVAQRNLNREMALLIRTKRAALAAKKPQPKP